MPAPVANNYRSGGRAAEPGDLQRHPCLGALADQRRLERADPAELPEHGRGGHRTRSIPLSSQETPLGAWQETSFTPAYDKDKWENTSWTVNGKVGDFKLVYTGGYLDRTIDNATDYTNYTRSAGGFYYTCAGGGAPSATAWVR